MFEQWPKHKSGIRPAFSKQEYVKATHKKWRALHWATKLYGVKVGDLWKQKRPAVTVSKIDREIKLKGSVLENPPEYFPELKFAGCSLQYIIMLAECLGGATWYRPFIKRQDEAVEKTTMSKNQMETLLQRFQKQC